MIGDKLAEAAYFLLEGSIVEDKNRTDWCLARGYTALAVFCKRKHFFSDASKFYELASQLFSKDPSRGNTSRLQLANSLHCKAMAALSEKNFSESCQFFEQAAKIYRELGKPNEATYCEGKMLEAQSIEFEAIEDYKKASELILKAADVISNTNKKLCEAYRATSIMYLGELTKKEENFEEALKYFENAAERFKQIESVMEANCKGKAMECKAFLLKLNIDRNYYEIAEAFFKASEYYEKTRQSYALICRGAANKYLALDAKTKGERQKANQLFTEAKSSYYQMLYRVHSPKAKQFFESSVLWCEGMATACIAEELLLENIQRKEKMNKVIDLLASAASLLSRSGDLEQAEIVSNLIHFAMAIDAFYDGNIAKANGFIEEARAALPPKFLHSLLKSEITSGWQPLRYALGWLEMLDNYRRRLETEKGYSFESRVRDLIRKMYTQYEKIEDKTFNPQEDEIGIVFKDKTPIEIDALGVRQEDKQLLLLVAEAKDVSRPVSFEEATKFLKKIQFVQRRYNKVARLQTLDEVKIEYMLFISKSLLVPSAKELLMKSNVDVIEGESIDELFKKYHLFPLPK